MRQQRTEDRCERRIARIHRSQPIGRQRQRRLSVVARMLEQGARDEDVQRAGDLAVGMAVSDTAGEVGRLDEGRVVGRNVGER